MEVDIIKEHTLLAQEIRPKCFSCDSYKLPSDFYANDKTCKDCRKARVRKNRAEKLEYYQAYDRARANKPERLQARLDYAKTEKGARVIRKAKSDWTDRNKNKKSCYTKVSKALKDGTLIKLPCEVCGSTNDIEGHHDDYDKPLDVRWLCTWHHAQHHKEERELKRKLTKET